MQDFWNLHIRTPWQTNLQAEVTFPVNVMTD